MSSISRRGYWNCKIQTSEPQWVPARQLASLTHHAIALIQGVVHHQLHLGSKPKGFQALHSIIADPAAFERSDLVTLNHDLLLESVLEQEDYCDGFSCSEGDVGSMWMMRSEPINESIY